MIPIGPPRLADLPRLTGLVQLSSGSGGPDALEELRTMCRSGVVLCAWDGDAPVGLAMGRVAADELEIHSVAVHPEARRAGLGRRLVVALEQAGKDRGAAEVFLEVRASNTAARTLYARAGYTATGTRAAYYRDGEDAVLMHRALEERCGD